MNGMKNGWQAVAVLCMFLFISNVAAETIYIRDELRVSVRGKPDAGAYLAVASTGEPLEVVERGDGYTKVRTPNDMVGWISNKYLVEEAPAVVQLPSIKAMAEELSSKAEKLDSDLQECTLRAEATERHNASLAKRVEQMSVELDKYQGESATRYRYMIYAAVLVALGLLFVLGYWLGQRRCHHQVQERFGGLDL